MTEGKGCSQASVSGGGCVIHGDKTWQKESSCGEEEVRTKELMPMVYQWTNMATFTHHRNTNGL